MNTRNVSSLGDLTHTKALLKKIRTLHASRARSLVLVIEGERLEAAHLDSVVIDETAPDDQIAVTRASGDPTEYYDITDIQRIQRLRSRRWLVILKRGADDAQATV